MSSVILKKIIKVIKFNREYNTKSLRLKLNHPKLFHPYSFKFDQVHRFNQVLRNTIYKTISVTRYKSITIRNNNTTSTYK